jgi:teichuronic acid biosynthesis glycosyltransferase TuaG
MGLRTPLISIIMPAYNAENTIQLAISSVINQSFADWELLVVNDCSTDKTDEILRSFAKTDARIIVIENKDNQGVSMSRHNGVVASKGTWIAFLDSDDVWREDKLEKQLAVQKKTNASLLFTGSAFMDNNGDPIDYYLHAPERLTYHDLLKQNLLSNSSSLVKAELIKKYESIGDQMHEDYATWLKIMRTGIDAYGVDEPLLIYRLSSGSKSSNKIKAAKMNWNTYRYVGLNVFASIYYMFFYTINGIKKYKNLK